MIMAMAVGAGRAGRMVMPPPMMNSFRSATWAASAIIIVTRYGEPSSSNVLTACTLRAREARRHVRGLDWSDGAERHDHAGGADPRRGRRGALHGRGAQVARPPR